MRNILITGCAGFIGSHLTQLLLEEGDYRILGIDNLNHYYDVRLKEERLKKLGVHFENDKWESKNASFSFFQSNLSSKEQLKALLEEHQIEYVVHLAAQAGVRHSLENPESYVQSNLVEFVNLCEAIKEMNVKHFVFASSSSVYGTKNELPYHEDQNTSKPVSLYGATKKANEVLAHSYASLYGLTTSGLRFFTVYGEWGRPDMAYFSFTEKILAGKPIDVFNNGQLSRDFTYIMDIVWSIKLLLEKRSSSDDLDTFEIFNIGNGSPIQLMDFIEQLEKTLGKEAHKIFKEMQDGDIYHTYANCSKLHTLTGFTPKTPLNEGLEKFASWYRQFYNV